MVKEATILTLFGCALLVQVANADAAPGFTGQHVVLHRAIGALSDDETPRAGSERTPHDHDGESMVIARARVWFSADGFQAISADGIRQSVSSFSLRRAWLMDRIRLVAMEQSLPELHSSPSDLPGGLAPAGIFATVPCVGQTLRKRAPVRWRGREVVPHECMGPDGSITATHDFSEGFALVVRTRSPDGRYEEFRHIERIELPAVHFQLPSRYRIVDSQEFRHGVGPLPAAIGSP